MSEYRDTDTQAGMSYVWGYQDALKELGYPRDSNDAHHFGQAWGKVCQLYRDGKVGHRPTMEDAFQMWRTNGRTIRLTENVYVLAETKAGTTYVTVNPSSLA